MRRIAALAVIVFGALAVMGSGGGSYQGGSYGSRGASYQSRGVAKVDTVTLFLTTRPDTTHFDGRFTQDRTAAGDAGKLRLGADTQFRYDVVAQGDTSEAFHTYTTWKNVADHNASGTILDPRVGQAGRYAMLMYVNWEDIIPANSQIVSAQIKGIAMTGSGVAAYDRADSVVSVLMSAPADSAWMIPVAGETIINGLTHHGFANWNWQVWGTDMGASGARGHPAVSRKKWSPALIDRVHPWQIGDWASFTTTTHASGGVAADSLLTIDITNPVQGAVNGSTNNGIFIYIQCNGAAIIPWWLNQWQGTGNLTKIPWIKVKYLTRRYTAEFPGNRRGAFVFSTDDQVEKFNSGLVDSFRAYGGAYTIYVREDGLGDSSVPGSYQLADYDSLTAWRNRGMEIGSHSRFHWATWPDGVPFGAEGAAKWYGLNAYHSTIGDVGTYEPRIGLPGCATGYDSLLYDSEPYWLYDGMGAAESDLYVGKSIATPGNKWRMEVVGAVAYHGYVAARTGQGGPRVLADGNRPFGIVPQFRPAVGDTIWNGLMAHDQLAPRNLVWQALDYASSDFVGPKADTLAAGHLDSVRTNARRAMYYAKNKKTAAVNLFTHAEKSNANYTLGINHEEMGAILSGIADEDGWIARASEYARWLQAFATPVATPSAFSQPDSFSLTAEDRVWFITNQGIDYRWIRGVK